MDLILRFTTEAALSPIEFNRAFIRAMAKFWMDRNPGYKVNVQATSPDAKMLAQHNPNTDSCEFYVDAVLQDYADADTVPFNKTTQDKVRRQVYWILWHERGHRVFEQKDPKKVRTLFLNALRSVSPADQQRIWRDVTRITGTATTTDNVGELFADLWAFTQMSNVTDLRTDKKTLPVHVDLRSKPQHYTDALLDLALTAWAALGLRVSDHIRSFLTKNSTAIHGEHHG